MAIDYNDINLACIDWSKATLAKVKAAARAKNIQHRANSPSPRSSLDAMASRTKKSNGMVNRISFGFPKVMAYVHYGVGKNRAIGSGKENPKYIFDVINSELPALVEQVSKAGLNIAQKGIFRGFIK